MREILAKTLERLKLGESIGAVLRNTNNIVITKDAIMIPFTLTKAFFGFEIFLILSPLYKRLRPPQTSRGRIIDM